MLGENDELKLSGSDVGRLLADLVEGLGDGTFQPTAS